MFGDSGIPRRAPDEGTLKTIRERYPEGCRVVLDSMGDFYAPPIGTAGTVRGVDSMGTIHVQWDNGSTLGVVLGEDSCHRID